MGSASSRSISATARDTAVKARSAAIITLKTLIVNAPDALRETLDPLTDRQLIDRCVAFRLGDIINPTSSAKHALRALATRWRTLSLEVAAHDDVLDTITRAAAPTLHETFGIGTDSVAEMMMMMMMMMMMIVAGDNPTRVRSEAAFAKLCGASPVPASSGVTNRHRLLCGGHRQANAALYRIVIVRMRWHEPTIGVVSSALYDFPHEALTAFQRAGDQVKWTPVCRRSRSAVAERVTAWGIRSAATPGAVRRA